MTVDEAEYSDVLIIGAGISGIGAAYRVHEKNPKMSYTILERRQRIGGTWDLFRYPGIRSDSDIFTLSFPMSPGPGRRTLRTVNDIRAIPDGSGPQARHRRAHPVQHPRPVGRLGFDDRHLDGADRTRRPAEDLPRPVRCSSAPATTTTTSPTRPSSLASISSAATWCIRSTGRNPWTTPASGSMVIGSGATAVSMIPALDEKAAHVTMLQRLADIHVVDAANRRRWFRRSEKCCRDRLAHSVVGGATRCIHLCSCTSSRASAQVQKWLMRNRAHTQSARRLSGRRAFQTAVQPMGPADCA